MKRIGLISDTHSYIDDSILEHFSSVDEIWHAGDIGMLKVTDELAKVAPLRGVYGNIDNAEIRQVFPEHALFTIEGLKVWITHIGGYPGRYPTRIKTKLLQEKPGLFICGHSHILKVMPDKKHGLLHINPGAAGKHGFHKVRTIVRFSVEAGKLAELEVVELGSRGKIVK